jgi:hypothetical protein
MVRFPNSETDENGVVRHPEQNPIISRRWKARPAHKVEGLTATPNVGNVTEGSIVGALVSVFRQLEEMGVKRQ